jgi:hypothetical protein
MRRGGSSEARILEVGRRVNSTVRVVQIQEKTYNPGMTLRDLAHRLPELARQVPAVTVIGPRHSG